MKQGIVSDPCHDGKKTIKGIQEEDISSAGRGQRV
jgi:hypothetical protein